MGAKRRGQAATEYLSTYGWSILIISIVAAALFYFGVFTISAKATPGGCRVARTKTSVSFVGTCDNKIPKFVAGFNGTTSQIRITNYTDLSLIPQQTGLSVSAWFRLNKSQADESEAGATILRTYGNCGYALLFDTPTSLNLSDNCNNGFSGLYNFAQGVWYSAIFTVGTGQSPNETLYINGQEVSTGFAEAWVSNNKWVLFCIASSCAGGFFNGNLADIQVYNTTLTQSYASALYKEGIGGVPADLQHLVAWWPLNGDTIDYGGHNNNGQDQFISFTSSWEGNYTTP